jgi:hypothetical protein
MLESSLQPTQPRSSAGYRPLISGDFASDIGNSAYGYVAAAAGLGLVIGVALAITSGHANVSAAPQVSGAQSTYASAPGVLPSAYAKPGPSLLSQVENQKKIKAASGPLAPVDAKSTGNAALSRGKHRTHKLLDWKSSGTRKGAKRRPYVSPNPPAAPEEPTALQLATSAAASGPFFLGIQGDATVASFDEATGTIQTYEGETYILDKTAGEGNAIAWQNFPFNVHYSCDAAGNCTLFHDGASAAAKLTR